MTKITEEEYDELLKKWRGKKREIETTIHKLEKGRQDILCAKGSHTGISCGQCECVNYGNCTNCRISYCRHYPCDFQTEGDDMEDHYYNNHFNDGEEEDYDDIF